MSDQPAHDDVANLEYDETIPPRPEEEIADALRAAAGSDPAELGAGESTGDDEPRGAAGA
ncbi:hypothetical protein [Pengzhenrongella sicca]|uniref:Uncharacterized protein n=1 Tax=Pengzhenrongella sicca TaxID=2819238 RepID=A0A8A4ZBI2_9MICO|nr:hypothetical protein [Pengzhenrongella sicca]QTE27847.1 hypothetical protein J4E96_10460 [Pengzhenrongella sicca]